MRERFLFTFLFHLVSLSLVLLPKPIKGPVVMVINGVVPVAVLDAAAAILILAGSVFLFISLCMFLKSQPKIEQGAPKITNQHIGKFH